MASVKSLSTNVLFNTGVDMLALNAFRIAAIVVFQALKMDAASFAYCTVVFITDAILQVETMSGADLLLGNPAMQRDCVS